ncbi:MAG: beta-Ala-His dipeptidase, partial [Pseudomonadota bacterium]
RAHNAGLKVKQDPAGNVCICVPATAGKEKAPAVVLQAHIDMVCEKNEETLFDFTRDSLRLVREGDWIRADGTTLGADNGIGAAAALAAGFASDLIHGPLEILLTVDEETGLTGARGLSHDFISGRILLNLDSESSSSVCIGCAGGGGVTTDLKLDFKNIPDAARAFEIKLFGLQGGHSGLNIHENRGNAVKLMARLLQSLMDIGIDLADLHSGDKHNAIPREAKALISIAPDAVSKAAAIIELQLAAFKNEFSHEPHIDISWAAARKPERVLCRASFATLLNMLFACPHGVLAMSRSMPGLVETSNNLASVHLTDNMLRMHTTPRSSLAQALKTTASQIVAVGNLAGAESREEPSYPGWHPNTDSRLLHIFEKVYESLFGNKPKREATHAGLECGIIGDTYHGMDMISFGPDIRNCHSPVEAVNIRSVEKFWNVLTGLLAVLAKL